MTTTGARTVVALVAATLLVASVACDSDDDPAPVGAGGDGGSSPTTDGGGEDGSAPGRDSGSADDAGGGDGATNDDAATGAMALTSSAFTAGGVIPATHSCDGAGTSIPIAWSGGPAGTQSYAVVMRDLTNTNGGNNYHWVLWDIPAATTSLAAGVPKVASPDPPGGGAKQTNWSFGGEIGYGHMCPIVGPSTHEYELVVYAIPAATLPLDGATGPNAIHARIVAEASDSGSLKGSYTKQ
ncbi:MAG: YbhB/YbcL family Raf kinase inhibitor-like protein [Labilithrix sp.]|nr:YbhB/YbcL family Raf kinase inhibitor-like protein [Labilithrix sp.]